MSLKAIYGLKGFSYIMLKPDGNSAQVLEYVYQTFASVGAKVWLEFPFSFCLHDAKRFYPKDEAWRIKYGNKRISFFKEELGDAYTGLHTPLEVGNQILDQMALYLASGPCRVIVFLYPDAPHFGSDLVGATVPKDASEDSLRGRFGNRDSIEVSASQQRALRNVAHAPDPDDFGGIIHELDMISKVSPLHQGLINYCLNEFR